MVIVLSLLLVPAYLIASAFGGEPMVGLVAPLAQLRADFEVAVEHGV